MKRIMCLIISIIMLLLFVLPASAQTDDFKKQYETLNQVFQSMYKDNIGILAESDFRYLSESAIDFLKENNIDTSLPGKVYYEVCDDVLTLKVLTLLEDNNFALTAMTNYGEDENGEYRNLDLPDLAEELNLSWSNTSSSGY